mmetsp:Transcript_8690/g.16465  ORF Transcript_8690/g.16465 Transcript_8690/m.16465 type:complete len:247 (+) Transcript_8690:54-794(+)|eukprot:CAMPEP_0172716156 /NCGR_PEP_ID=MMETSP1074-20121228/67957_1 /TAXON_ID=2916 /ORGANISM="Ceratium fusus, Strain PA161109" /LENGTH=246 /DNA_ID=CAMNT_0013540811 /DNA_START=59 /DNA_END=799 /DNA_ORIENTATION=+
MSDNERGSKGKGKGRKGEGKGKEGGRRGRSDGGGSGGAPVSRLKVVPKFLQEIHAKLRPSEEKRGLSHAELMDKRAEIGTNDDDEYDFEGAQFMDGEFSQETMRMFARRGADRASATKSEAPRCFFASEAPRPVQDEVAAPVKFRGRSERGASATTHATSRHSAAERETTEGTEVESGPSRRKMGSVHTGRKTVADRARAGHGSQGSGSGSDSEEGSPKRNALARRAPVAATRKKQRLSFDADEDA